MTLALRDVRGLLNSLNDALSGPDGEIWREALAKFLRKENPWPGVGHKLMSVRLDRHLSGGPGLVSRLDQAKIEFSAEVLDIVLAIREPLSTVDYDLIKITVAEMGFVERPRYVEVRAQAQLLGLSLCPLAIAPELRLLCADQLEGEHLIVASELLECSDVPRLLVVGRNSQYFEKARPHLRIDFDATYAFTMSNTFVFVARQKTVR